MNASFKTFVQNPRQESLVQKASEMASKVSKQAEINDQNADFSHHNVKVFQNEQYLSLTIPEICGGENLSLYEFLLMQERLAMGDGPAALSVGWHLGILMELRDESLLERPIYKQLAEEVGTSQVLVNRAASEPATGSPTRGGVPETTASYEDGHYIISGRKTFTTMASVLDYAIINAFIPELDEVGWFLIPLHYKGVKVDKTWDTLGMRGTGSHDLVLEDVKVPEDYFVERKDDQPKGPKGWLLHIPACYLGIALAASQDAIEFAKYFQPNSLDTPISEVGHIQQKIGEMELKLMQARHFMYSVARQWDEEPEKRPSLSSSLGAVKTTATNTANEVVDLAMRIAGGRGLSKSYPFEKYYRDVRAGLHNPPMDDMVLTMLAKEAIGRQNSEN